jgi:hypothetical protein
MDYVKTTELIATILCLVGCIYGTLPRRIGLVYLIIGTVAWIFFAVLNKHWFFFSQEIFLLCLNVISLKTWKDQGIRF